MNLFEKTDCKAIWFDPGFRNVVQPWLAERDMRATMVSPVNQWFPKERWPHFPYDKPFDKARWDPMVMLHTSESTGFPKPILARQGMISIADAYHNLPEWQGTHIILQAWSEMTSIFFNPSTSSLSSGIPCLGVITITNIVPSAALPRCRYLPDCHDVVVLGSSHRVVHPREATLV